MEHHHLHNVKISRDLLEQISQKQSEAKKLPSFPYPWQGLEEAVASSRQHKITLVGYGSLLNSYSALRTLSIDKNAQLPVISFGVKRLYNYKTPQEVVQRHGECEDPFSTACLNAVVTYKMENMINGLTFVLKAEEIEALRQREKGYDLIPVVSIPWHQPNEQIFIHYILSAPNEQRMGNIWVSSDLKPILNYDKLCRAGALSISEDFLEFFLKTTFLADGNTLIARH